MRVVRPRFTYEHLLQLPEDGKRHEVLAGELCASPSPKPRHQRVGVLLADFLLDVERAGHGRVYPAPVDVFFNDENVAVPDLVFVAADRQSIIGEAKVEGAPDLVVEVLSPKSRKRDLGVKLAIYARFGVRWYWVVDPDAETVQTFERGPEGLLAGPLLQRADSLTCPLFPDLSLPLDELFAG